MGGSDYSSALEAAKDFKPDLFIWAGYAQDALPAAGAVQGHEVLPAHLPRGSSGVAHGHRHVPAG